jgi:acetate---CoA ligase (ADP-forming) subunit alpha
MAADACGRAGLTLPTLSQTTIAKLKPLLPHTASVNNPVDMTFARNQDDYAVAIPKVILEDDGCDALLIYFISFAAMMERMYTRLGETAEKASSDFQTLVSKKAETLIDLARQSGKPVIGFSFRSPSEPMLANLIRCGMPVYQDPMRAVKAVRALVEYKELREKIAAYAPLN